MAFIRVTVKNRRLWTQYKAEKKIKIFAEMSIITGQDVLRTLHDPAVHAINFNINGISIVPAYYIEIAQLLATNRIEIHYRVLRAGRIAEYHPSDDILKFRVPPELYNSYYGYRDAELTRQRHATGGQSWDILAQIYAEEQITIDLLRVTAGITADVSDNDQQTIIHECTHAILDNHRVTSRIFINEGAAYIAGIIYHLKKNSDISLWNSDAALNSPLATFRCACRTLSNGTYSLDATDITDLRNEMLPSYPDADRLVTGDGVRNNHYEGS